jgi:hypothetical protein
MTDNPGFDRAQPKREKQMQTQFIGSIERFDGKANVFQTQKGYKVEFESRIDQRVTVTDHATREETRVRVLGLFGLLLH